MTKKREKFDAKLAHEKAARYSKHVQVAILNPLCLKISMKALNKVYEKYVEANEYYTKKLPRSSLRSCTHQFRAQMGLPCVHEVLNRLQSQEPFDLVDIDPHWHIEVCDCAQLRDYAYEK